MIKILFVCMGNICRSPTAQAVFQHKIAQRGVADLFEVDSAGTHAYHVGKSPDSRASAYAQSQGVDMSALRARKISVFDYEYYDFILAMDQDNLELLHYYAPADDPANRADIRLLLSFAHQLNTTQVPDPYYGGDAGFAKVFDLIDHSCDALIDYCLESTNTH